MYANTEHTALTMHRYLLDIYFDQFSSPSSRPCIMYVWWSSAQHNEEILFFRAMAMVQSTIANALSRVLKILN